MPTEKLPILGIVDSTRDSSSLNEVSQDIYNFLLNAGGGLTKRGGLKKLYELKSQFDSIGARSTGFQGVQAVYWDGDFFALVIVCRDCVALIDGFGIDSIVFGWSGGFTVPKYKMSIVSFDDLTDSGIRHFLLAGGAKCGQV